MQISADVVLGAFAGALFFLVMNVSQPLTNRILLAIVSFISGLIGHNAFVAVIAQYFPVITNHEALAALIVSAVSVSLLSLTSEKVKRSVDEKLKKDDE